MCGGLRPFAYAVGGCAAALPLPAEKGYNLAELISAPMDSMAFMILRVVFSPG